MADHRVESCFQAQLLCMQLRVATLRTEHHVVLGLVIRHADQHDLAVGGQVFRRLGYPRSPLSYLLGLLLRTIIHDHLVTGIEQPLSHMTAHVPHTDEANARFQMVAFHIHCNTFLSSEMLSYDPLRHTSENLLSYKDEVEGSLESLDSVMLSGQRPTGGSHAPPGWQRRCLTTSVRLSGRAVHARSPSWA